MKARLCSTEAEPRLDEARDRGSAGTVLEHENPPPWHCQQDIFGARFTSSPRPRPRWTRPGTKASTWHPRLDYWTVDFDYESRKEIIKVPKRMGVEDELPGVVQADPGEFVDFEERWTGAYIFENEWQSFRTRQNRDLELTSVSHTYAKPGRYTIAVKVIDIFGNDTMTLMPVTAGGPAHTNR